MIDIVSKKKVIYVNSCQECPFNGQCKAWKALSRKDRVYLTISTSVPLDMVLEACPLEEIASSHD